MHEVVCEDVCSQRISLLTLPLLQLNSNDTLGSLADGSRKVFAGCTAQNQGCTSFSIFTVKFNTSKAEACVAVATTTTTTTDSHAGHGHRRSDAHDHSGTQMVMAITVS